MRIAAVIVLFHPNESLVLRNISRFIDDIDLLIVYRNSKETICFPEEYAKKIREEGSGENDYIAGPLNRCIEYCLKEGYDYLLTMDQDSQWTDFSSFLKEATLLKEPDTVIYAPNVNHLYSTEKAEKEVESVITSGSLCNVGLVNRLGGFREEYQIYWVDGEFCYWARKNGYKIKVLTNYPLSQCFGKETRTLGGFLCANYSPIVYYFMFRNMIWMRREYSSVPGLKCICYTSLFYIRGIVLGEKYKIEKLCMILKGCINGWFGEFNKRMK